MRRTLLSFLIASLVLFVTTFAGLAFFGMGSGMATDHGTCIGSVCDSMPGDMSGMECLSHCLSAIPASSPAPLFPFAVFVLALLILFLHERLAEVGRVERVHPRWRSGIGKLLLHQNLSTIILRN